MGASTLNKLYVGVFGVLLFSPRLSRGSINAQRTVAVITVWAIQATFVSMYYAAGLAKAFKGDWLTHHDTLYTQIQGVYRTDLAAWLLSTLPVWCWTAMQWVTLAFELEAPVLFAVRKLRPIAFTVGLGFHLMIALMMKDLIYFSLQMWSFYALFISAEEYRLLWRRATRYFQRLKKTNQTTSRAPPSNP